MDGEGSPSHGGSFRPCSGSSPVFGRISVGVGRTPRSVCVRDLLGAGEFSAHQYPGDEGPVPGLAVLPGDGYRSSCDRDMRQLDGGCSLNRQLLQWAESFDIQLEARYFPGQSNVLADLLSCRD